MIELKDIIFSGEGAETEPYNLVVRRGELCVLPLERGRQVVNALLGFAPVSAGYVSYDGMVLDARSVAFMRKIEAYVPEPEGFEHVGDLATKQAEMIDAALESEGLVLLAVNPFSHQSEEQREVLEQRFRAKAEEGRVVVLAI